MGRNIAAVSSGSLWTSGYMLQALGPVAVDALSYTCRLCVVNKIQRAWNDSRCFALMSLLVMNSVSS